MLKAVLFDLDGTLLDIDLDGFLREYFTALGPVLATLADGLGVAAALDAVMRCTDQMCTPHAGTTNRDIFNEHFERMTGVDLTAEGPSRVIDAFYTDRFPALQRDHRPRAHGIDAVTAARTGGLKVAVATNPIFPLPAIHERMRWAELDRSWFDVVTSYETMEACKPDLGYFRQVAEMLEVEPSECLMVGDDPVLDLAAADIGMKTFYVGPERRVSADWSGGLDEVARILELLTHTPTGLGS